MRRSVLASAAALTLMGATLIVSLPMPVSAQEAVAETNAPQPSDPAEMVLRLNRLETLVRQLSGQIEELQFQNSKLQERLSQTEQKPAVQTAEESKTNSTLPQGALAATDGTAAVPETPAKPVTDEFDNGKALYKSGEFVKAASALRLFIAAKPEDKRIAEATYMIGESEYQQKRYTEAAKNYLKIIQAYPKSTLAPQSLVQLGASLMGMGQKPQACATLSELSKRYPDAPASVVAKADQERKAGGC